MRQKVLSRYGIDYAKEMEIPFHEESQTNMRVRGEWRQYDYVVAVRFAEKLPFAN